MLIEAARGRDEPLDHLLLSGPPGLGKTTLATVIANELGVQMQQTSGPAIERAGDLAAILTNLEPRDVLFIDEIHRLNRVVEEVLYPAMEDFSSTSSSARGRRRAACASTCRAFTLIGATTRTGLLTGPLRDRFGMAFRLDYYNAEELQAIVKRSAGILGVTIDDEGAAEIARRSRGTPRLANRLLKRVRDYAQVRHDGRIDRGHRGRGARVLPGRPPRPRPHGRRRSSRRSREVRRPAGRSEHARERGGRGAGHARGRLRAVPAAARASSSGRPRAGRRPRARTSTWGSPRRPMRRSKTGCSSMAEDPAARQAAASHPIPASAAVGAGRQEPAQARGLRRAVRGRLGAAADRGSRGRARRRSSGCWYATDSIAREAAWYWRELPDTSSSPHSRILLAVGAVASAVQLANAEDWVRNRFEGTDRNAGRAPALDGVLCGHGDRGGAAAGARA